MGTVGTLAVLFMTGMVVWEGGTACNMISRSGWGAARPRWTPGIPTPVRYVFIHHTAGRTCSSSWSCADIMRRIQNDHMNRKSWPDIGYSFLVGGDGRVYEGRGWGIEGAHTYGYNRNSIAISFIGNFVNAFPTQAALRAAKGLIHCGVRSVSVFYASVNQNQIARGYELFPHSHVYATACPGARLAAIIKHWPGYSTRALRRFGRK